MGKYLIVSDIHANREALATVIADAREVAGTLDGCWCLGDVVGYGPQPAECLAMLRDELNPSIWVLGNHDAALVDRITQTVGWSAVAKLAISRNRDILALDLYAKEREWAVQFFNQCCPIGPLYFTLDDVSDCAYVAVHGTLDLPLHGYLREVTNTPLIEEGTAREQFTRLRMLYHALKPIEVGNKDVKDWRRRLFVGQTHIPTFLQARADEPLPDEAYTGDFDQLGVQFNVGPRALGPTAAIINPGSVGQPRDGDTRAAYAIYDASADTIDFRRVEYNFARTQGFMRQPPDNIPFPDELIDRLATGR